MNANNKNAGIIATIATILFCGLPGLVGMCIGLSNLFSGVTAGGGVVDMSPSNQANLVVWGMVSLCFSFIGIAIPIVIGFFTFRKKTTPAPTFDEPIPPTS